MTSDRHVWKSQDIGYFKKGTTATVTLNGNKIEGQVENTLPPKYGEDYRLGDIVEVNAAGWQGRQRITKVRHVLEPNRISITPVIGDDFLDLRQFISREVNK